MSAAIILLLLNSAPALPADWNLKSVTEQSVAADNPVGYIYKQEVVGIATRDNRTTNKRASLSLVCSVKDGSDTSPKIILQWEGLQGYGTPRINYTVDSRITPAGNAWTMRQENDILYKDASESRELLQGMKQGRTVAFDWVGSDQTRYLTTFNLNSFRNNLSEFNTKCKSDI